MSFTPISPSLTFSFYFFSALHTLPLPPCQFSHGQNSLLSSHLQKCINPLSHYFLSGPVRLTPQGLKLIYLWEIKPVSHRRGIKTDFHMPCCDLTRQGKKKQKKNQKTKNKANKKNPTHFKDAKANGRRLCIYICLLMIFPPSPLNRKQNYQVPGHDVLCI